MSKFCLGSGPNPPAGFIGVDVKVTFPNIQWDLSNGLPPQLQGSEMICNCHLMEHFTTSAAIELIQRIYDCLAPNGVYRMALPNFRSMATEYLNNNRDFWNILHWDEFSNPMTRTLIDVCEWGVYQPHHDPYEHHKSIWDVEKAIKVLEFTGFKEVKEVPYDPSIEPNTEVRRRYTFVVVGVKP